MPFTDKTKTTEFGPSLLGTNPKPAVDIYFIYLSTAL
jgi:hypothetical protein